MINNVVLVGRLTKEIELKKTPSNLSTCTFTIACDKRFKVQEGQPTADFIQCVAWRQSAEFLNQYAHKGDVVGVEGSIQTRSYDGQYGKVYITEVLCDRVRLIGNKGNDNRKQSAEQKPKQEPQQEIDPFQNAPSFDFDESELPFY